MDMWRSSYLKAALLQLIPTCYEDSQSLFEAIRATFKKDKHIEFYGTYNMPADPLIKIHHVSKQYPN